MNYGTFGAQYAPSKQKEQLTKKIYNLLSYKEVL